MKKKKTIGNKGFTLIELLIAAIISVLMLGTVYGLYVACERFFVRGLDYLDIHSDARLAMDFMASDIKWADKIKDTQGSYATSGNCIILEMPSINSSKDIIYPLGNYDYIIYYLQGTAAPYILRRVVSPNASSSRPSSTRVIAKSCRILQFSSGTTSLSSLTAAQLAALTNVDISLITEKPGYTLGGAILPTRREVLNLNVKLRNK